MWLMGLMHANHMKTDTVIFYAMYSYQLFVLSLSRYLLLHQVLMTTTVVLKGDGNKLVHAIMTTCPVLFLFIAFLMTVKVSASFSM